MAPALAPSELMFDLVLALPGWHLLTKGKVSECSVDVASASAMDDDGIVNSKAKGRAAERRICAMTVELVKES